MTSFFLCALANFAWDTLSVDGNNRELTNIVRRIAVIIIMTWFRKSDVKTSTTNILTK